MAFEIKAGATRPTYVIPLLQKVGTPQQEPIPGLDTASSITFVMRSANANPGDPPKVRAAATVKDATTGEVEYIWAADGSDTDVAGAYQVEFEIAWAPGAIETVPNKGFFDINVNADLDHTTTITDPGDIAPSGHAILNAGALEPQRSKLDFVGATVVDDAANDTTRVTVSAPAAGGLVPLTIPGQLAVAAGLVPLPIPRNMSLSTLMAAVKTAPQGGPVTIDINRNGTSIFASPANRPVIAAGQTKSSPVVISPSVALVAGDVLTVDVDTVGLPVPSFINVQVPASVTTGTTVSAPEPTGAQLGDLLWVQIQHTLNRTWTLPTGFTQIGTELSTGGSGGPLGISRFFKIHDGTPGPYVFTASSAISWGSCRIAAYRGITATNPVDASATSPAAFDGSFTVPSFSTSAPNDLLVVWGNSAQSPTPHGTPPAGLNVRQSGSNYLADMILAAAGAQSTITIPNNANGSDNISGGVAFKADAAAAVPGSDLVLALGLV